MDRPAAAAATDPETWVDAHGDYLFRFALARTRRADAAADLVQETLLAALAARHRFAGRSTERTWLTAILKRKTVDWLRERMQDRARREPAADATADDLFTRRGGWTPRPTEWAADHPGRDIARAEFRGALADCLDELPGRLRQAFVLRYVDGAAVAAVAGGLGASGPNVWVMLHRARLRLWRCLAANGYGEPPGTEP